MKSISKAGIAPTTLAAALLMAFVEVHAQSLAPDSGQLLRQVQPALPTAPSQGQPSLNVESKSEAQLPASAPFEVNAIRITGNSSISSESLRSLVAGSEGKKLTLIDLQSLAGRITALYQEQGYPLARAIIPAQTINEGVVEIRVLEAKYGTVKVANTSQVTDELLAATAAPLQRGRVITEQQLNRSLLLLSDVPGVSVNAIIKPGADVGTSDLDISASAGPTSFGDLSLDNYGNKYIGRARAIGSASLLNPLHHGDILSATVVTTGSDMNYGRVSYDTLLNGLGTRAGGAYSYVRYKLGGNIASLDANGTAGVASLWVRQPLLRSREANVYAQLQYDGKRLRDRVDVVGTHTDRTLDNVVLSLNGDLRDNFMQGGINSGSIGLTNGRVQFNDAAAKTADAASARTNGQFTKWNVNLSRLQALSTNNSLYVNFAAQQANKNLDSAEKLAVGGPYTVRAYDIGAMSADNGYFFSMELRRNLGAFAFGQVQAQIFADTARVKINRDSWSQGDNSATLSGAGIGVNWTGPDLWKASAYLASRVGKVPSQLGSTASAWAWVTVSKSF